MKYKWLQARVMDEPSERETPAASTTAEATTSPMAR
jgi:hypothetical protein